MALRRLHSVRRAALLTLIPVLATIGAACRHDGRTLREPRPDQNVSISTVAESSTTDAFTDGGTLDSALVDDTADGTLPASDAQLSVTAPWVEGAAIDPKYTCDGDNVSPALSWSPAPTGTTSIAISMADLDAPTFGHWVISGLGAGDIALAEDTVPVGAVEATNGAGSLGYTGPCPPAGSTHHYTITVHYLGDVVNLTDGATVSEMLGAINAAELATAEVTGTFSRP